MPEEDSDAIQSNYQENVFVGVGTGADLQEASHVAFDNAWRRAKAAGKQGRPLRIAEQWVSGNNPITWYKVVLVDDGG